MDIKLFQKNIPILGLCYGMQLITHLHGGKVARAKKAVFITKIGNVLNIGFQKIKSPFNSQSS